MEEVIALQLTLVVKKDVYLLLSGSRMNKSVGKMMDLNDS